MKQLKAFNIIAVFLIFTPFFQMCSSESLTGDSSTWDEQHLLVEDSLKGKVWVDKPLVDDFSNPPQKLSDDTPNPTLSSRIWEQLVMPEDNITLTGFGLSIVVISKTIEHSINEIWLGAALTFFSVILVLIGLIKLSLKKHKGLFVIYRVNAILVMATLATALFTFEHLTQIKWGFIAYFIISALLTYRARKAIELHELKDI